MPELPEVETTRLGLSPLRGKLLTRVEVRDSRLRQPVSPEIALLREETVHDIQRRGKYLLFRLASGWMMIHLGMSGSLRLAPASEAPRKHDHLLFTLSGGQSLRFHDPRRFGLCLWLGTTPDHPLLRGLGPEPLEDGFTAEHLFHASRRRSIPVKSLIMDNKVVVGVGNIYASESLFYTGLHPLTPARTLTLHDCELLWVTIRHILGQAILRGGTTLRDFVNSSGNPGYFRQELMVYGREGENCRICGSRLAGVRIAARATVFCPTCQPVHP